MCDPNEVIEDEQSMQDQDSSVGDGGFGNSDVW